jgi:hypothetical protein
MEKRRWWCSKCSQVSERDVLVSPCPVCATENTVGTQPTDVQQLKAEIFALLDTIPLAELKEFNWLSVVSAINAIRQKLSAV